MSYYTNIITLEQAKLYLKIDSAQTDTDAEISVMIDSALSFIEKYTCHIMYPREKTYYGTDITNVYDFPIDNSVTALSIVYKNNYAIVPTVDGSVTLTVGYATTDLIPNELIQAALQIIGVWFYNSEGNQSILPISVHQAMDNNKRFI